MQIELVQAASLDNPRCSLAVGKPLNPCKPVAEVFGMVFVLTAVFIKRGY